ncbi:MAG TPA: hypothetical protein VH020_10235 [Stellaceae bacterium]|jgi:hypothetical protein|nr:hypothetical protein [Stellaceae bacterium]
MTTTPTAQREGNLDRIEISTVLSGQTPSPETPSTFRASGSVFAATSRWAGRINASSISQDEFESLHQERQVLVHKKYLGTITQRESNRLEYVRWSLDRIEDARHGWVLDRLETAAAEYEQLVAEIKGLQGQLKTAAKKRR